MMSARPEGKRANILASAGTLAKVSGLTGWSIEACSREARCAKGLVLHYFGSKDALLREVAHTLAAERWNGWRSALAPGGIGALDTLFDRLTDDAASGAARALLELRLSGVQEAALPPPAATDLQRLLATALELPPGELPAANVIEHLLEGYLLALIRGASGEEVREAFFRYWLSYVR